MQAGVVTEFICVETVISEMFRAGLQNWAVFPLRVLVKTQSNGPNFLVSFTRSLRNELDPWCNQWLLMQVLIL